MNFKKYLTRLAIIVAILFFTRMIFQFPIEYFQMDMFRQTEENRLFSKIDALVAVAFAAIFFSLYNKDKINQLSHPRMNWKKTALYLIAGELSIIAYYALRYITNYYSITKGAPLILIQAGIILALLSSSALITIAVFQMEYLKRFYKIFKNQLAIYAGASVILYAGIMLFQSQWFFFSSIVANTLYSALSQFYSVQYEASPGGPLMTIKEFAVRIGPPCSGIDSMLLFTAFFAGLFAIDYKRIMKGRYALFFILGLIGVFFINILRLFILIIIGANYSPEFAVGMFHTNAGWVLFIAYFLGYYQLTKRFIYTKNKASR